MRCPFRQRSRYLFILYCEVMVILKIYDAIDGTILHPLLLPKGSWYITHAWGGLDRLTFDIPPNHAMYPHIAEEIRVTDGNNRYIIKNIDECATVSTIECELDMDDWRQRLYLEFRTTDQYLSELLDQIKPDGWSIINAGIVTKRATVEASEGKPIENATPYDLLGRIADVYGVVFYYDVPARRLTVIDPTKFTSSGKYIMEDLNLKSVKFVGCTKGFATRLYARGKDGLTFADVNDGKDYIEDHSYSNRVISVGWKDERYTIPENLLAAAKKRLSSLAYPARSYECTVNDLAKINPDYDFLSFALYHIVTLVDKRRKNRINHQIVEYKDYPDAPEKNTVTLSNTAPRIQSTIQKIQVEMDDPNSGFNQEIQGWIDKMAATISGYDGGNMRVTFNALGKPNGIQIMDTDNTNTAQSILWFNLKGILYSPNGIDGPYSQVWSFEQGGFVADWIVTGQLRANLIKAGKIQSQTGAVYFDLDANGGKGELAASVLKSVEDGVLTIARIGSGEWADGSVFQGLNLYYPGNKGGVCLITLDGQTGFPLANQTEFASNGDLMFRSNAIGTSQGGNNTICMTKDSAYEGNITITRGTRSSTENLLCANKDKTELLYKNNYMQMQANQMCFYHAKRIEFATNGYARASIEADGSARFGDIYSNGILVTSDRAKKADIFRIGDALDIVENTPVYHYRLKSNNPDVRCVGIMYDEAPEEIRREDSEGNRTIDLYGMVSLLWRSIQELSAEVKALKEGTN